MVHEDRGPVGPQAAGCLLGSAEAVGPQENVLQLSIRVGNGAGVVSQGAECVPEQQGQLGHGPVKP
jgi:hypothetical protein